MKQCLSIVILVVLLVGSATTSLAQSTKSAFEVYSAAARRWCPKPAGNKAGAVEIFKLQPELPAASTATRGLTGPTFNMAYRMEAKADAVTVDPGIDRVIRDIFKSLAEIANKKLQQKGLALAKEKLEKLVCNAQVKVSSTEKKQEEETFSLTLQEKQDGNIIVFPSTCRLVQSSSLDTLIQQPSVVRTSLVSDAIDFSSSQAQKILGESDYSEIRLGVDLVKQVALQRPQVLSAAQIEVLLKKLLEDNACWAAQKPSSLIKRVEIVTAIMVAKKVATGASNRSELLQLVEGTYKDIIKAFYNEDITGYVPSNEVLLEIIQWADVVTKIIDTTKEADLSNEKVLLNRYRLTVQLILEVALSKASVAPEKGDRLVKALTVVQDALRAALEENVGNTLQAITDGLYLACSNYENKRCDNPALANGASFLKLVGQLANSYEGEVPKPQTPEQEKAQHELRRQYIEGFIDATTVRTNRQGDEIWSLGMNIGMVAAGYQINNAAPSGERKNTWIFGQVALPLGVAYQRLPGAGGVPLHLMLTLLDLGQYVAWSGDTGVTNQRWDTAISPGLQVGYMFGPPDNAVSIGVQATYAPTLFTGGSEVHTSRAGAFRAGVYLQYYVPIFDFN